MNRRDAVLQQVVVVEKAMAFASDYVTCNNCAVNYSTRGTYPGQFCQYLSMGIDNDDIKGNEERAASCAQWCPVGVNRNKIITPDYKNRYEKDDFA